ncbi:MAG TPA: thiamine phosphate synthase [Sphingomonas sp.]|nr:thiamine phosphate synthase [Sphingomonas sp.]
MAHAQQPSDSAPASSDDRAEDFALFLDQLEKQDDDIYSSDAPGDEAAPGDPDAADQDEASRDAAGEPGETAITAPISWGDDAKALFEQLPPELQSTVAAREAQRERALQQATTDAADARRNAMAEASASFAEQQRHYAAHLERLAAALAPERPDPALLAEDPQAFYELQALYDAQLAEHQALTQQARHAAAEAQQRDAIARSHELAQDHAALGAHLGEDWTDISRRRALLTDLEQIGASLGYSMENMGRANATDILALKAAADWKAKADRYDALQSNRMTAVAAARGAPRVAKPGVSPTRAEQSARGRDAAWARAKAERSGDAYAALLDSMGIVL